MKYTFCVGILFGFISFSEEQQYNLGCPAGWIQYGSNCYNFVDDDARVFQEADAACWWNGSTLLSVNNYQENEFVTHWLVSNYVYSKSLWYTSGYHARGTILWEGQNTIYHGPTYWIREPRYDEPVHRIVYAFDAGADIPSYGWLNVSASTVANYICEKPRSETMDINILVRDFEYGPHLNDRGMVKRGPNIIKQPVNIVIVEGVPSISLECWSTGNPYPSFTWWRGDYYWNGTTITSGTDSRYTLSGGRLTIQNPRENDIGSYHCMANNEIGTVLSNMARLTFGYIQAFSNILPSPIFATAFKGVKMDCNPPAFSPSVSYQWFEDEVKNTFIWPDNEDVFASHSGTLYISEVQPTDADKYYFCVTTLVAGEGNTMAHINPPSKTSLGVKLVLTDNSITDNDYGPIIYTHAFPSPALRGGTIRLECVAYGTRPMYYSWRREDGRDFTEGTKLSALNRVLEILEAPLEAEGNYICTAKRGNGEQAEVTISVAMQSKPYFPFPVRNMFPDPGMEVNWYCKAVARPAAIYTWYKDGKLLSSITSQLEVKGNNLKIRNVDKSRDEGIYQCAATNNHGTTFSTGQLKVLSFAPHFHRFPLSVSTLAPLGGNITIQCGVEAAPIPQVSWLRNGADLGLVQGDLSGHFGMDSRYGLVISSIQYGDAGTYSCKATNTLGQATNTTVVTVIDGIQITQAPVTTKVSVNRTAFLYCDASYNRPVYDLTYTWSFNGRPINKTFSPEYVQGQRQNMNGLYITSAQYKHSGQYECKAYTTLHSASRSASLQVQGPPAAPAGVYADNQLDTKDTFVRLVWTVESTMFHGGDILSYDIEAETNFHPDIWHVVAADIPEYVALNEAIANSKRNDQRMFTVQNLVPNTGYRFRVRAINTFGRGQEASRPSVIVKIPQQAPIKAPGHVSGGGGKVGTLTVTWKPLDIAEHCGPNLGYIIYWKKLGDTRDWMKKNGTDNMALKEGKFVITVGLDNYYLQYHVKVRAFNDDGPGPNSTKTIIYSAEGMPASVPILKESEGVNGTSVIIYWEPVPDDREHMKGRVGGYRVYYYENKHGQTPYENEPDPLLNEIISKDVYGQTDHAQLIGLQPYAEYFARAQVFNSAGAGTKGEWRRAETANYPLRQFPTHIQVFPRDRQSVRVKWRGINIRFDEESVQGFILRVWKVQEDIRTAKDVKVGKVMEAVVGGLQIHTVYELRVLGYSRAGDGALSEAVFFTLLGGNIPFDPSTTTICYASTTLHTCSGITFQLNKILVVSIFVFTRVVQTYV